MPIEQCGVERLAADSKSASRQVGESGAGIGLADSQQIARVLVHPDDAQRLLQLLYSLIMVSFPVEIWRQPYIPDTGTASFELKLEPRP